MKAASASASASSLVLVLVLVFGCGPSTLQLGAGAYGSCNPTDGRNAKCQSTSAALGGGTDCALVDDGRGAHYCVSDSTCGEAQCPAGKSCVLDRSATPAIVTCR